MKTKEDTTEDLSKNICSSLIKKRHINCILCLLGVCNLYILRHSISVAMVAMVSNVTVISNETLFEEPAEFQWSSETQGIILSAFFYGYVGTQMPGGLLAQRFGGKNVFGFGLLFGGIITLLIPVASRTHVALLVTSQVALGMFGGVVYPGMFAFWSKWAPPLERSTLLVIPESGVQIGTLLALLLSGFLAEQLGWPSVFYVTGAITVAWFAVWYVVASDSPSDDPRISEEEQLYIETSLANDKPVEAGSVFVPWKALLTSCPVWAFVMAHFSFNWGFYTFSIELPSFVTQQLKFDIATAGTFSSLPYIAMAISAPLSGWMADLLLQRQIFSTTVVRKLFTLFGSIFLAVFLIITSYSTNRIAAVVCLTLGFSGSSFLQNGFFVNALDIAPPYASILIAISSMIASSPGIVSPILTGVIVQNQESAEEWRIVFYIAALILVFVAIFFCIFGSGDKQEWAGDYSRIQMELTDDEEPS